MASSINGGTQNSSAFVFQQSVRINGLPIGVNRDQLRLHPPPPFLQHLPPYLHSLIDCHELVAEAIDFQFLG